MRQLNKTDAHMQKIRMYLQDHEMAKASDIAEMLNLSAARTRALPSEMEDIEALGANRIRTY